MVGSVCALAEGAKSLAANNETQKTNAKDIFMKARVVFNSRVLLVK